MSETSTRWRVDVQRKTTRTEIATVEVDADPAINRHEANERGLVAAADPATVWTDCGEEVAPLTVLGVVRNSP